MPSNNSKYTEEMRERTAYHIIKSRKSTTSVAEEMGKVSFLYVALIL